MADNKFTNDLAAITKAVTTPTAAATLNLARERGNDIAAQNQILTDRNTLSPIDFQTKYGQDLTRTVDSLDVTAAGLSRFMDTDRTLGAQASDIGSNIGVGLINSIGGAVTLGARALGPDAARAVAQTVKADVDYFQNTQSPEMKSQRDVAAIAAELDKNDQDAAYKKDVKSDGQFTAELRSFGRSAADAATRLYENPTVLESGLAEGIGSIVAAAPTAGMLNSFKEIGKNIVSREAAAVAVPAAQRSVIPASIGVMEGGASYAGAVNEVLEMPFEDLQKNSAEYRDYLARGFSKENARQMVADSAGVQAAAIQGPLAAATGNLVAGFEGAPLAANGLRHAVSNILREGAEEGVQSLTGEAASNFAIQQTADETRRIGENLGGATAEGAILGLGSAGGLQGVGLTVSSPVKGVLAAGNAVSNFSTKRGEAIEAAKATSALADVQARVNEAVAEAPAAVAGLQELAQEAGQSEYEQTARYVSRAASLPVLTENDLGRLSENQKAALFETAQAMGGPVDRFTTIMAMAGQILDAETTQEDKASAALFIADQVRNIENLKESTPEFLLDRDQNDPRFVAYDQYIAKMAKVLEVPEISKALDAVKSPDLITPDTLDSNTARNIVGQADHMPENVDVDLANRVLLQTNEGNNVLSDLDRAKIKSAIALNVSGQTFAQETGEVLAREDAKTGNVLTPKPSQIVSNQIAVDGGDKDWQLSMAGHVRAINNAMTLGSPQEQTERMVALNMFAQSMANKVAAFIESMNQKGKLIPYESAGESNNWFTKYKAGLHVNNANSVELAQTVFAEAKAVAMLANNMSEIYPQFNLPTVTVPELVIPTAAPVVQEAPVERSEPKKVETTVEKQEALDEAPVVEQTTDQVTDQVVQDELAERPGKQARREAERQAQVIADEKVEQEGKKERRAIEAASRVERVEEANTESLETRYPDLLNEATGPNQFYKAYTMPKTEQSRLTRMITPLKEVLDMLSTPRLLADFIGENLPYDVSKVERLKLASILQLGNVINTYMKESFKGVEADKIMKAYLAGKDANMWQAGRNLNIVEKSATGYRYNRQLVQSAILAGINQALNAEKQKSMVEASDVADITGMPADMVDENIVAQFNRGLTLDSFKRALADNIINYWGVNKNNNTTNSEVLGIAEGVAAEVIEAMDKAGLISVGYTTRGKNGEITPVNDPIVLQFEVNGEERVFAQNRVHFDVRDEGLVEDINSLGSATRLLDSIALVDKSKALGLNIGQPSGKIPAKQLRSEVDNAPQQKEAIAAAANQAYLPNMKMHSFMQMMGYGFFQKFMGGYAYEVDELHPQHERSVEGKNLTLKMSYDSAMSHMDELASHASVAGLPINEVPTYFDFNMSKVGRLQMQGGNTPQSDKLWRELYMPTRSVLDMTVPEQTDLFWMTVAQGLGVKTEKDYRSVAVAKAQKLIDDKYSDIVNDMVKHLDNTGKLDPDLGDRIISAMGKDASMHGLHSLMSVAALRIAERDGSLKEFEHFNYLEADGKTNGPIMTVALFASEMSAGVIKVLRKGGIFLGEAGRSLNSYITEVDEVDLYESTTNRFKEILDQFTLSQSGDAKVTDRITRLNRILGALDANIEFTDEGANLVMSRGVLKNPLTISIYGSGIDGIATKVANGLLTALYEKFSETRKAHKPSLDDLTYAGFAADFDALTSETLKNDEGQIKFYPAKGKDRSINGAVSQKAFNALQSHIRVLFVDHMHEAINDQILQHVNPATNALQVSTQLQSIFLTGAYQQGVAYEMEAEKKKDTYRKGDWISRNGEQRVMKGLEKFSPIIKTGKQNYFIAGSEKSNLVPKMKMRDGTTLSAPESYASAMSGRLRTPVYGFGPSPAGVKGTPSLVIGNGDGMIMQNALAELDIKDALPVFDGINFRADKIDEYSEKVNEAVWMAMQANPMEHIADSFNTFLANDPVGTFLEGNGLEDVSDFIINEVSATINGKPVSRLKPEEILSVDEIRMYLQGIADDLNEQALRIEARNVVLGEWGMSFDQMASGERPFVKEGTLANSSDPEVIAQQFAQRFDEVLAALREGKKVAPAVEVSNNEVMTSLMDTTTPDESGARIATIPSLQIWLDNASVGLSTDQKAMMAAALQNLKTSGYRIIFGSREQINEYEGVNYPEYITSVDYLGKVVPEIRHIYVTNITGETLLHELIHAATLDKVIANYDGSRDNLAPSDRDAIDRIEGLMKEWLVQSTEADSEQLNTARLNATNQVTGALTRGDTAIAINEFMAWVLSNQALIKGAKKVAVKNPLFRVMGEVLNNIKALIWGKRSPSVGDDIYSNLRFNTRVLMKTPTPTEVLRKDVRKTALFQSASFGSNNRLTNLRNSFSAKVLGYLNAPFEGSKARNLTPDQIKAQVREELQFKNKRAAAVAVASDTATTLLSARVAGAFNMDAQSASTFEMIHTALSLDTDLKTNALSRVQDMYAHVIGKMEVEDLMVDPLSTNPADRYAAQNKFDILTGAYASNIDVLGRSDRLPTFLALAMVDEQFRNYLSKLDTPKTLLDDAGTLDAAVDNAFARASDALTTALAGDRNTKNVRDALDKLSFKMAEVSSADALFMEQYSANGIDRIDNFISDNINSLSDKVIEVSNRVINNANNSFVRGGARLVRFGASLANETEAAIVVEGLTSRLNSEDANVTFRELVAEIVGRSTSNSTIFDMINSVRSSVQQVRQQFREKLPAQFASKFKRTLTEADKTTLFRGLGKTDAAALFGLFGVQGTLDLIKDDTRLQAQISTLESSIRALAPTRQRKLVEKARQLADYMNNGNHGENLLRNAHAIAHLFGETGQARTVDPALVSQIDALTSLYALDGLDKHERTALAGLANTEGEGMNYLLSYLVGTRKDENANITTDISRVNNYKGHLPSLNQQGVNLRVAMDSDRLRLERLGYVRVGDYVGSSADRVRKAAGYYYAPVSGRATYNQGVLQTVHQTVNGIQPSTGFTTENIAGRITDPKQVAQVRSMLRHQRPTNENLLPVYDQNGKVIAYERSMDPRMLSYLNKSTNLPDMVGVWRGRQIEEKLAQVYNQQLIENLNDIWEQAKKDKRTNEFVDLSQSTDPVLQDTWGLIPENVRKDIEAKFGKAGFPIRRDMINDAVGFRSASIGDMWTGDTRVSDKTAKQISQIATGIFGQDAYQKLVSWEKTLQNVVIEMKVLIVVKSVIVPLTNAVSNVYQLMHRGVPLLTIARGMGNKATETTDYIKRRAQEVTLDADLKAAQGRNDLVQIRKITNQIEAIKDSYKRMSIWPLIEAGEFTAITEGGVSNDDLRLSTWIDKATNYLPEGLQTPYRYGVLTKDTALFQGMARAVQYSDFLAKAVLYDDLTKRKKMSKADALAKVSEEFVNYNRYAGRVRNYAESTGLIWFWNFKLRSMKIAASMIRENPARSLVMTFMPPVFPLVGNVGDPISDNMLSVIVDGKLDNSIGPSMGLRAPTLNPWYALFR